MNYKCNCHKINFQEKNLTYWENREVTTDEKDIIDHLSNIIIPKNYSILHIGIGNSFFAENFCKNNKVYGITLSKHEILKAKKLNLHNYNFFLCDKYSDEFKLLIQNKKFDLVIDTNLKSYSCCQISFEFMMKNIFESIKSNGMLITSINGMKWFKKLKPKLSFNFKNLFHFKLKEVEGDKNNILSIKELEVLSNEYNFRLSYDNKLCYLKK